MSSFTFREEISKFFSKCRFTGKWKRQRRRACPQIHWPHTSAACELPGKTSWTQPPPTCVHTKEYLPVIRKGQAESESRTEKGQQSWARGCRAPRHCARGRTQQDSSHAAAQRQLCQPGCSRLLPFPPFKSRKRCGQAWEFQQGWDPTRDRWSHQMNLVLTYPGLRCPPPPLRHVYIPRWKAKVTRWFTPSIT